MLVKKNNFINPSTIYIILWLLYNLSGIIYSAGGIVSKGLFIMLAVLSIYWFIYAIIKYKLSAYMRILSIMIGIFCIYGIFPILNHEKFYISAMNYYEVPSYNYLKGILLSLLPIYAFYVFSLKGWLSQTTLQKWFYVFLGIILLNYFTFLQSTSLEFGFGNGEFTNNTSYILLSLLPMSVLFYHKPKQQYLILALIIILILAGMKRGAILITICSLVWFLYRNIERSPKKSKVRIIILCCILLTGISYYLVNQFKNNAYFQKRIEQTIEGNVSGRDQIIENLLYYYNNETSNIQKIFGSGANATINVGVNYAHNDWVEILINQGVIGIVIYLIYWIAFYYMWRSLKRDSISYTIVGLIFMNYFARTVFSMSYGNMSIYSTICLGYCLANKYASSNKHSTNILL